MGSIEGDIPETKSEFIHFFYKKKKVGIIFSSRYVKIVGFVYM